MTARNRFSSPTGRGKRLTKRTETSSAKRSEAAQPILLYWAFIECSFSYLSIRTPTPHYFICITTDHNNSHSRLHFLQNHFLLTNELKSLMTACHFCLYRHAFLLPSVSSITYSGIPPGWKTPHAEICWDFSAVFNMAAIQGPSLQDHEKPNSTYILHKKNKTLMKKSIWVLLDC